MPFIHSSKVYFLFHCFHLIRVVTSYNISALYCVKKKQNILFITLSGIIIKDHHFAEVTSDERRLENHARPNRDLVN